MVQPADRAQQPDSPYATSGIADVYLAGVSQEEPDEGPWIRAG